MPRRIKFSVAFAVGGVLTFLTILVLQGFAQPQVGMSDGSGQTSRSADSWSMILISGYFAASAAGLFISKSRLTLWVAAGLAHSLLLAAYAFIYLSAKNGDPDGYKWHDQVKIIALVMAVYFSPWIFVWVVALLDKDKKPIG